MPNGHTVHIAEDGGTELNKNIFTEHLNALEALGMITPDTKILVNGTYQPYSFYKE